MQFGWPSETLLTINGDHRAQAKAYELLLRAFGVEDEVHAETALGSDDEAIIRSFLERAGREKP